ncbi:hypothetical protein AgCh_008339 [Apium graveolens]
MPFASPSSPKMARRLLSVIEVLFTSCWRRRGKNTPGEAEQFVTPMELLNSIESVEKMERNNKVEWDRKIRTLMSMR